MKTFQECWTEYVGECKYSPYLDETDTQFVEEVAKRYTQQEIDTVFASFIKYLKLTTEQANNLVTILNNDKK